MSTSSIENISVEMPDVKDHWRIVQSYALVNTFKMIAN